MADAVQPSAAAAVNDGHHPHPLFLRTKPRMFKCGRCKCDGFGRRYICRQCKVCFHELCATCPEWIEFFMHADHTLTLQRSYNPFTRHKCEACGDPAHGYFYRCKPCSFELHPFCSLLQPTITDEAHPGHTLGYVNGEKAPCTVCGEECVGWRYMCQECPAHVHMKCLGVIGSVADGDGEERAKKGSKGKKTKTALKVIGGFGVVLAVILAAAAGEEADVNFDFGDLEIEGGDLDFDFDFEVEEEVELEAEAVAVAEVAAELEVAAAVEAESEAATAVEAEAEAEGEDSSDSSDEEGEEEEEEEENEEAKEEEEEKKKKSRNPFKSFLKAVAKGDKEKKDKDDDKKKKKKKDKEEDKEKN